MLTMKQWTNEQGNINVFAPLEWTVKNWQSLAAKGEACNPGELLKDAATSLEWAGIDATALKDLHTRWENAPFEWGYADSKLVDIDTIRAFTAELTELAETIKAENPGARWTVRNAAKHEASSEAINLQTIGNSYVCDGFKLTVRFYSDAHPLNGELTREEMADFAKIRLNFYSATESITLDHDQASQVFADWGTARWWVALRVLAKTAFSGIKHRAEHITSWVAMIEAGQTGEANTAGMLNSFTQSISKSGTAYRLAIAELEKLG